MKHGDNVLVVSPTPSHPQSAGNRARIFSLLSNIQSLGYQVHFLHVEQESGDDDAMQTCWGARYYKFHYRKPLFRLRRFLRKMQRRFNMSNAFNYHIDEWYDPELDLFVKGLQKKVKFQVVMVEYVFFSRVLECFDDSVLKVIDTHDVFTDRYKHYLSQNEKPTWFSTTSNGEARGLNRADIVIAIQKNEEEYFSSITNSKIVTIGHIVEPVQLESTLITPGKILLLASNNKINLQAAKYFLDEIFPIVKNKVANASLALAGSICDVVGDYNGVIKLGIVDDVSTAYQSAAVVVNPMLFGTGLKIKSIEALSHGKPLVTTPTGAEGIENGRGQSYRLAADKHEFAEHVISILMNPEDAYELSVEAHKFTHECNQMAVKTLMDVLYG